MACNRLKSLIRSAENNGADMKHTVSVNLEKKRWNKKEKGRGILQETNECIYVFRKT